MINEQLSPKENKNRLKSDILSEASFDCEIQLRGAPHVDYYTYLEKLPGLDEPLVLLHCGSQKLLLLLTVSKKKRQELS